ncbi:MAG: hypothetical protein ACE5G8_14235, partial [Anaerolineae bacterium]
MNQRFEPRTARLLGGALILLLALILWGWPVGAAQSTLAPPFTFGVINNNGLHYDDEWSRGVRATTLELQWRLYEPQEGVYDTAYIALMQQTLAALKAQG